VYVITNTVNGKKYVGRTVKSLEQRWNNHLKGSMNPNNGMLIAKSIAKYGPDAFERKILEECDKSIVGEREMFWIKELRTHVQQGGYNLTLGGDGGLIGYKPSEETKRKRSEKLRGQKRSLEAREKMRIAATGRKRSPEVIEKTASKLRGRKQSPEAIAKRSLKLTGKKISKELLDARRLRNLLKPRQKRSDETRRKMSEAAKRRKPISEETRMKLRKSRNWKPSQSNREAVSRSRSKAVIQFSIDDLKVGEYSSIKNASIATGFSICTIQRSISQKRNFGKNKFTRGSRWDFKDGMSTT